MAKRVAKSFYDKPCSDLAKNLLGQLLCRRLPDPTDSSKTIVLKGRIVETEMYPGTTDKASHSADNKRTPRNGAMFMEPGTSYVYMTYGMYFCFNISAQEPGGAILIRAIEPTEGIAIMRTLRPKSKKKPAAELKEKDLCSGPSKLCQSFCINKENSNEVDMTTEETHLWLEEAPAVPEDRIYTSTRIGIEGAGSYYASLPYRFYEKDNEHVSVLDKKDKEERKKIAKELKAKNQEAVKRSKSDAGASPSKKLKK